tara:strand:+ start:546 stop:1037 length:492 start_codon:yes stop_codon:yes gene_type:complete
MGTNKNQHNKDTGSNIERSDERIAETQEVFTPMEMCERIVQMIDIEKRKNPESKFLDNSAGSGNFIIALKNELIKYHSEQHVLDNMLYAVELMEDNHKEMCERVGVPIDHPHYVCYDALEYDYSFGEPVELGNYGLGTILNPTGEIPTPPSKGPSEASLDKFF